MGCEWKVTDSDTLHKISDIFWLCLRALNIFSKLFSCFPGTYGHLTDIVSGHNLRKWVCIVCFSHWSSQRNRVCVSVTDRLTALDCDHRSVERTLMAMCLAGCPSLCLSASLSHHTFMVHMHITTLKQSQCLMGACLLDTTTWTQSTNEWWRCHGAVISALVPHHLLLMVVINWWMRSNRRYWCKSQFGYFPITSLCSPLCHPLSCFLIAQCTIFPPCSSA